MRNNVNKFVVVFDFLKSEKWIWKINQIILVSGWRLTLEIYQKWWPNFKVYFKSCQRILDQLTKFFKLRTLFVKRKSKSNFESKWTNELKNYVSDTSNIWKMRLRFASMSLKRTKSWRIPGRSLRNRQRREEHRHHQHQNKPHPSVCHQVK